jgi:hypothetical protein
MHKVGGGAIGARGEQIKTNGAEHLWICRGIRPCRAGDYDEHYLKVSIKHSGATVG